LEFVPATKARVAEGAMSLRELCAAAIQLSDNTATNLILNVIGGPAAVTALARSLGDEMTRSRPPSPEQAKTRAMPADNSLRFDDH
jgi:beta-lactamase class A